ncbi:CopD family protein [Streptomyces sulphureus]|uniref:CopD family protein n=1 Tax=Streptomyces sulphureus TaxID=47758 RepID=UPI00037CD08E|nr:CopD family protein [Streptomyces sulphureus]
MKRPDPSPAPRDDRGNPSAHLPATADAASSPPDTPAQEASGGGRLPEQQPGSSGGAHAGSSGAKVPSSAGALPLPGASTHEMSDGGRLPPQQPRPSVTPHAGSSPAPANAALPPERSDAHILELRRLPAPQALPHATAPPARTPDEAAPPHTPQPPGALPQEAPPPPSPGSHLPGPLPPESRTAPHPAAPRPDRPRPADVARKPATHRAPGKRWPPLLLLAAALVLVAVLGPRLALDGTNELGIPGGWALSVLRTAAFCGLALAVGEVTAVRLAHSVPEAPGSPARRWAVNGALVGAVAAAVQLFVLAGTGSLGHRLAELDLVAAYGTRDGALALLEANAFAAAALCAGARRAPWVSWTPLPLLVVIVAEAFRAHPEADTPLVGSLLTFVHLTAATVWTGGLLCVLHTMHAWRREPGPARVLLQRYTRVAAVAFTAVVVTGTFSTLRRLPLDRLLDSAYGRTFLIKLALIAAVALLAFFARRRLRRLRGADPARGPVRAELALLAGVMAVSAVLTAVPVPAPG